MTGSVAPGYPIIALLHAGGGREVYDVWSEERSCRCVAKVLAADRLPDRGARRRLLAEGRLLRRLTHPHIVRGYAVLAGERPAVILETLTGATLGHLLDVRGRLPVRDAAVLGLQLCSAIGYLHGAGHLHLDLKPSNVVAEGGRAKLIDLSIARPPGRSRTCAGTRGYLSPEQARGDELTAAADVWGLAGVIYEALTGESPLVAEIPEGTSSYDDRSGSDAEDLADAIAQGTVPVARRRRLPRALTAALDAGLALHPAARPGVDELAGVFAAAAGVDPRRPAPWQPL